MVMLRVMLRETQYMAIDIEKYRTRILAEKERLEADRARLTDTEGVSDEAGEMADADINHPADTGTETFERAKDAALAANIDGLLAQVDEALAKMGAGTYGTCDRCGKPIGVARLEAIPYATLCVDCQDYVENNQ
jgi:RNA polymerase-binding protein DksA